MMHISLSGRYVKRVLAQVLTAALVVTSLPLKVIAAEDAASLAGSDYIERIEEEESSVIVGSEAASFASTETQETVDDFTDDITDPEPQLVYAVLKAGEGCFDLEEITDDALNELSIYVPEGKTFGDAVLCLDETEDGTPERRIALEKLPKPNRDNYEFVCWYLEEYENEDLSGLLSVNKITEETEIDAVAQREDITVSEEKGIEIYAVWKKAEPEPEDTDDAGKEASSEDQGAGYGSSNEEESAGDDASTEGSAIEAASDVGSSGEDASAAASSGEDISDEASAEGSSIESADAEDSFDEENEPQTPSPKLILVSNLNRNGIWIAGLPEEPVTYTGAAITFPDVKVYNGAQTEDNLIPSSNYTIAYKNNVSAGTATVTVTFKNNYSGKISDTFTIAKADMSKEAAEAGYSFAAEEVVLPYNGKAQKGVPVITYTGPGGKAVKLKNGTDFTLEYPGIGSGREFIGTPGGSKADNTFKIKVTGKGSFEGTLEVPEYIMPTSVIPISKVKVIASGEFTSITYREIPEVAIDLSVTYNGAALKGISKEEYDELSEGEKAGYDYYYINNGPESKYRGGAATLTICATGNNTGNAAVSFYGERTDSYKISGGLAISKATFSTPYEESTVYDRGKTHTQEVLYDVDHYYCYLNEGEKYEVSYKNDDNISAGTVTATYTGINGFIGTVKKNFKIDPHSLRDGSITVQMIPVQGYEAGIYPYVKGGVKPKVEVQYTYEEVTETLTEGKDYTLSYTGNTTISSGSKASVVITGKGNFEGNRTLRFTIVESSIGGTAGISAVAADKVFVKKQGNFPTTLTITDYDGKKLAEGTDYEKYFKYTYTDDTVLVDGTRRYANQVAEDNDIVPVGTVLRITAIGKGNYRGEINGTYRIVAADIAKASVKVTTQYYEGKELKPSYDQIDVKLSGVILTQEDYEIVEDSYVNNNGKGKASMILRGKGDYGGSKTVNFTISAKTVNDKYTIIFNGNGAVSGSMKNQTIAGNKSANLTANKYKRNGFKFVRWNTEPDGTGTSYADKQLIDNNIIIYGNTLTLYAQWEIDATYTITTHLGGWTKEGFSVKTTYTAADETYRIPTPSNTNEYQFGGWYKDSAYKTRIAEIKKGSTGNLDLYAKWIPYRFTFRFHKNGGDEVTGTMDDQAFSYNVSKALSPNKYKNSDKTLLFAGWAKSPEDAARGDVLFTDKQVLTEADIKKIAEEGHLNNTVPVNLYAVWKNTFKLDYFINPEEGEALEDGAAQSYAYGTGLSSLPLATKPNYTFDGWFTDKDTLKKQIKSVGKKEAKDYVLYPKWIPDKYTLHFDGNGADSGSMKDQSVDYGQTVILANNSFAKDEMVFSGWSLTPDSAAAEYADRARLEFNTLFAGCEDKTVTLYAVWVTWESRHGSDKDKASVGMEYTIFYDGNKPADTTLSGKMAKQKMVYGKQKALTKNAFKAKGYTFLGWSEIATAVPGDSNIYPDMAMVADFGGYGENLTLYAVWVKDTYHITYENVENADDSMFPKEYTVSDALVLEPAEQIGAVFEGWYSDAKLKKKVTAIKKGTVGDKVFYAKWKKVRYTVTYVLNVPPELEGSVSLNTENEGYATSYGDKFENGYVLATASREDDPWLAFGGWCKDAACKKYVGYFITDPNSDITLYAKWVPGTYSIRFDKNNNATAAGFMSSMTGLQGNDDPAKEVLYNLPACGYTNVAYEFRGWALKPEPGEGDKIFADKEAVSNLKLGVSPENKSITLYAQWGDPLVFTIAYMDGTTELAGMTPVSYTYFDSNISTAAGEGEILMTVPEKEGYAFAGWYKDAKLKDPAGKPEIPSNSHGDITLYAKWNKHIDGLPDSPVGCIDVTADTYGAVPDDDIDDSKAINRALYKAWQNSYSGSGSNTVYIPAGVYDITAYDRHSIKIYSNTNLLLDDNAVLNVSYKNCQSGDIGMLGLNDVSNIIISGGTIKGGKQMRFHQEAIHNILVFGGRNVTIANMKICDSWGDGIYLGYTAGNGCKNVSIINCEICDNRRNNISIIYADSTLIDGCYIHDAKGQQPEAGICVEPNKYDGEYHVCDGIYIKDTKITTVNKGTWWYRTFYTYHAVLNSTKIIAKNITFENVEFIGWYGNYNGETPTKIGKVIIDGTYDGR